MGKSVCVFCASGGAVSEAFFHAAEQVATLLAEKGHRLVYGGAGLGLMGALAQKAKSLGVEIVGVLPEFLEIREIGFTEADNLILTQDLLDRKRVFNRHADVFMVLPGGLGTISELLEVVTHRRLKVHEAPIYIINTDGFFDTLFHFFDELDEKLFTQSSWRELVTIVTRPDQAFHRMEKAAEIDQQKAEEERFPD